MILKSIRARLSALFSLCLALAVIAAVTGLIWYSEHSAERSARSLMATAAQRVVVESEEPVSPAELIAEEREDIRGTDIAISIVDSNGKILGRTQRNAPGLSSADSGDWRIVTSELKNGDTVVIGMPWAKTRRTLRYHAIALISLGAFVVLVASAGARFLVGRALTPIALLARQARASSAENLVISLEAPSQDYEMVELVDTLNGLLRRVTETAAAKGRFYSAASHELRTPLQALSGHLELARSRDRTREEYRAAVEEAHIQAERLVSLVRALLFLYQLESSSTLPSKEPADLVDVCRRSLSHFQPIMSSRGLQVDMDTPDEVEILAPPGHIDMLVRNVVENAARYSVDNGRVALKIDIYGKTVHLELSNDCDASLRWRKEEIFEPFSRPDSSRSAKTGGTGLGLAICKSIADVNGWRLEVGQDSNEVRVGLSIPLEIDRIPRISPKRPEPGRPE